MKSNYINILLISTIYLLFSCGASENEIVNSVAFQQFDKYVGSDSTFRSKNRHCLACHQGIMPSKDHNSPMMQQIYERGEIYGDPNGCIVCHGGNPNETDNKILAHGKSPEGNPQCHFTPTPAALQVNENSCGLCHEDHVYNTHRSIMNSDAGKAKYITWSWGVGIENKDHIYGNYDIDDPDRATPRFGTDSYKDYMKELAEMHPGQFPSELKQIPEVDIETLSEMPEQAAFTYLRRCNSCHISNSGGGCRGLGCAACHSLSSQSRRYEGDDDALQGSNEGRVMVHGMVGSRKSEVTVNGSTLSGVQVSTCASCHTSGRRIGSLYQGYVMGRYMKNDAHHRIERDGKMVTGLLCQDCHITTSMHGNGNIGATSLATVEIECSDCHGTPSHYPWDLALAYGDEFGRDLTDRPARGLSQRPMRITEEFGTTYNKEDGYLLTSRGNPFGNVVKNGNSVTVHSATGNSFNVPLLKRITETDSYKNSVDAQTAMVAVEKHMESLECYACHSSWTGQYYGNPYTIDYRISSADYISSSQYSEKLGTTLENKGEYIYQPGQSSGYYAHQRWETPPLGINGEGRVAPMTSIIQTVGSVIDPKGDTVLKHHQPRLATGERAMELSPLHPHTNSREARKCQDCHGNDLAMGFGIDGGNFENDLSVDRYTDIVDANGDVVSSYSKPQVVAIKGLKGGFDQVLRADGTQRLTIDSHWESSSPLKKEQIDKLSRSGTCAACHQETPVGKIPVSMLREIARVAELSFSTEKEHSDLLTQNNNLIAWIKALGILSPIPLVILGIWIYRRRKDRY